MFFVTPFPFSVQSNLPDNQNNPEVTYFSLSMSPGDSQTLEVVIYNSSDEEIEVEVTSTFAATNSNGVIVYDGFIDQYDESMVYPFDEISNVVDSEIVVEPFSSEIAYIEVELPEDSFDGHILGGVYVEQILDETEATEGVNIQNIYSYAIAVLIEEDGNTTEVEPLLEIEEVEGTVVNHRTAIQTTFANKTPVLISDLTIEASVYREGSEQPMFHKEQDNFAVAPNSLFNFP